MKKVVIQLFVLALISLPLVEAKARTIRNFRSLKGSNIGRIRSDRRLHGGSFADNPLIYSVEKFEGDDAGHGQSVFELGSEISQRSQQARKLSEYANEVQRKIDELTESVVDRVSEINNMVNSQLLGNEGI